MNGLSIELAAAAAAESWFIGCWNAFSKAWDIRSVVVDDVCGCLTTSPISRSTVFSSEEDFFGVLTVGVVVGGIEAVEEDEDDDEEEEDEEGLAWPIWICMQHFLDVMWLE